jgi:phospholipid/cholesterol/gamma-HCH transport system substrate-binding protein
MPTPQPTKDPSIRRQIVGLLIVAGLLVFALVFAIAVRHDMFTKKAQLHFVTENATGLAPGTTVRLSGYHIGSVATMTLQPDLKVRVTLKIDPEPYASLRNDATAVLVREQLRAPAIELRPGKGASPLAGEDPRIAYSRGNTLTEIADDLRERIAPILADVKEITGTVRAKQGEIAAVIENAASATRQLADTTQQLRALAGEVRGRVGSLGAQAQGMLVQANQAVARTGALVGQAQQSLDTVNAKLPALLDKSSTMLDQLNAVARDAKTISASTAQNVPALLSNVNPVVEDARDLVAGLKQAWPMKNLVPPPPSPLLPIDSLDAAILRDATLR